MLLRGKLTIVGCAGFLFATGAYAEGQMPKLGFEFRGGFTYDDGKINETDDVDAKSSTDIALEAAKISASGEAAKDVSYMFRYNLLVGEDVSVMTGLEHGWLNLKFSDMVSFSVGRSKVNQGGWHVKDNYAEYHDVESEAAFGYANQMALGTFSDSIGVHLALAGQLSINVLNDVNKMDDENGDGTADEYVWAKNDSHRGNATTIEWMGNFNGWMPLVQIMSYDLNKSNAFSVGVKGKVAGLGLMLNYTADNRKNFDTDPEDGEKDTLTQIDAHFSYGFGHWSPWLAYHSFDYKQGGDEDAEANAVAGEFDDNAQAIALGVECHAMGEGYTPYLALSSNSGKYLDADGEEESRSGMDIKLGVHGKF